MTVSATSDMLSGYFGAMYALTELIGKGSTFFVIGFLERSPNHNPGVAFVGYGALAILVCVSGGEKWTK